VLPGSKKTITGYEGKRKTQVSTGPMPGLEKRSLIIQQKRKYFMIDYDDSEVSWWMHEIEHTVREIQSSWDEITIQSVAMEIHNRYDQPGTTPSVELLEMCDDYLRRYNDPFAGLGDINVDLKILTESGKNALFTAVTAKSKLLKGHAAKLDVYIKAKFGDSVINLPRK
jgi:hypothetical protein